MREAHRVLRAANWRYAIGEVALIFIGISLALFANSWYEQKQERRDEIALLAQLEATLAQDLEAVESRYATIRSVDQRIARFVSADDLDSLSQEALTDGVGSLNRFIILNIRYGPYETLKARGLDLISNESLRVRITSLYEDEIPLLVEDSLIDYRLAREHNLPIIMKWFWLDGSGDWIVKSPDDKSWHTELRSLGHYRAATYRGFYLPAYERVLASMRQVVREIEIELDAAGDRD